MGLRAGECFSVNSTRLYAKMWADASVTEKEIEPGEERTDCAKMPPEITPGGG